MITFIFNLLIKVIALTIISFDKVFRTIFKKNNFLPKIHDILETKQYYTNIINNKKIKFFCPSYKTIARVETLHYKEIETLNWINNFKENENKEIIFWDIGSNIGIFSIYAAEMFNNIEVISFEPSTSNTRVLSRNISINNLSDKIKILPFALSDKPNIISELNETIFSEGSSKSSYHHKIDAYGKKLSDSEINNKYSIFGTTTDDLIKSKLLKFPNYIKIDVDGIEHLILKGSSNLLKNSSLKQVLVEMSPSFTEQFKEIENIFDENGFNKILFTNSNLIRNKDYKLKKTETLNAIFSR
tara:strand:- start:1055 stop:1954 length:900 start_codon:yes stop_codon:yes gene_type:complete